MFALKFILASPDVIDGVRGKIAISLRGLPQEASVEQAAQSSQGMQRTMRLLNQDESPTFGRIGHPLRDVGRGRIGQFAQEEHLLVFAKSFSYG